MKRFKNPPKTVNTRRKNNTRNGQSPNSENKPIKWKVIIGSILGSLIFLGGIGGFFTDFFFPIKEKVSIRISPPTYWECEQDRNIRGILLSNASIDLDSILYLQMGFQENLAFGVRVKDIYANTETCLLPEGLSPFDWDNCTATFKLDHDRRLLLSAEFFDPKGCLAGKIVDNQFVLNRNCEFTWNIDDYAFEVIDSDFDVVFSIEFKPPNILTIQGLFYNNNDMISVIGGVHWTSTKIGMIKEIKESQKKLKPIFEYFGKNWFGKRKAK